MPARFGALIANLLDMNDPTFTLKTLLDGIDVAMLTVVEPDGTLQSRPMQTQQIGDDGTLWFFASRSSHQVAVEQTAPSVNLVYVHSGKQRYVSVTGRVSVIEDRAKMRELWSPPAKIWFKGGPDDPDLVLLRVDVDHADYWDGPSNAVTRLIGFATAMITGRDSALGTRGRVDPR
jgi:general stress protein 26